MRKRNKIILGSAAVLGAAALIINPSLKNPPIIAAETVLATNAPPGEIVTLLRNACYDCHSDETKWPWYSHVAPVSWWLVDHIKDGRKHLNFSHWPHDDPQRAARKWGRVADEVNEQSMPLASYTWMHPEARFTAAQREQLAKWAETEAERLRAVADRLENAGAASPNP
jgi:heme-binding protein